MLARRLAGGHGPAPRRGVSWPRLHVRWPTMGVLPRTPRVPHTTTPARAGQPGRSLSLIHI
eukprot:6219805-Alexandrium_andersonii.AAC.1